MGGCCSKCCFAAQYWTEKYYDEDAWMRWDKHEARKLYKVERVLGRGAFSEVVAAIAKDTGRRVALKVVFLDNPGLKRTHADILRAEVDIVKLLHHPNIVRFDSIIHDPIRNQLVIAEEILLGGTLTEELLVSSNLNNDRLVAHIFKQLFSALDHIHRKRIVHRDLKPENIMFRAGADRWADVGAVPVLIDFGMSQQLKPGDPVRGLMGSPGFVAPEVIKGNQHSPALDMFAIGVMLYITITGRRPMTNRQANTLTYADFDAWQFPHMQSDALWSSANSSARDIVLSLLERDPSKRLTARQALEHPWVTADMRVRRPLAAASASMAGTDKEEAMLAAKRSRLSRERHQNHVEEMLRYMVLALQAREGRAALQGGSDGLSGISPASSVVTNNGSFMRQVQVHLPDGHSSMVSEEGAVGRAGFVSADVSLSSLSGHEVTHQGVSSLLLDGVDAPLGAHGVLADLRARMVRRSRSDVTDHTSASRTMAHAASALKALHSSKKAEVDEPDAATGIPVPQADIVEANLVRHLNLATSSMSSSSPDAASSPVAEPADAASTSTTKPAAAVPALPLLHPRHPRTSEFPAISKASSEPVPGGRAGAPSNGASTNESTSSSSAPVPNGASAANVASALIPPKTPRLQADAVLATTANLASGADSAAPARMQTSTQTATGVFARRENGDVGAAHPRSIPVACADGPGPRPPFGGELPEDSQAEGADLAVDHFPLLQGAGDRLFEVVMQARTQSNRRLSNRAPARNTVAVTAQQDAGSGVSVGSADSRGRAARASPWIGSWQRARSAAVASRLSGRDPDASPLLASMPEELLPLQEGRQVANVGGTMGAAHIEESALSMLMGGAGDGQDDADLSELRAVAQVQWGLRRWRRLAARLGRDGGTWSDGAGTAEEEADEDAVAADLIPEDVRKAQDAAARALRFPRAASLPPSSPPAALAVPDRILGGRPGRGRTVQASASLPD